ncbi:MAG TPA: zinc ribbon domain-containing protein [Dehalococcoidia bacterium]|nr:zinc ribbon domain-containing protein [Dehalococcoidia bacterium]
MPLYEYFCKSCDGIFETIRPIARAAEPAPCPVCARKAQRIPPTSFAAFTMREGYPRAIPDRGTYWHLGKEVKQRISGPFRPNEHPEINKPKPLRRKSRGEISAIEDREHQIGKEQKRQLKSGIAPIPDPAPQPRFEEAD